MESLAIIGSGYGYLTEGSERSIGAVLVLVQSTN